jgi:response regulator RpfG family c-di-GMP phosphodiesterase
LIADPTDGSNVGQVSLLLVDDEPLILKALGRLLKDAGLELLTADCGEDALRVLRARHVDMIMSDNLMPGMKGVELLSRARVERPQVVRMMLTGVADRDTALRAINESHVEHLIEKPWDDASLRQLLLDTALQVLEARTAAAAPNPAAALRNFSPLRAS